MLLYAALIILFCSCKNSISNYKAAALPQAKGIINDFGAVFNQQETLELQQLLFNYEVATGRQIVVVTKDSIKPYTNIQTFAGDLGAYWGVGNAKDNNGLVLALCVPCGKVGIATGKAAEKVLTNQICQRLIESSIIPKLKTAQYFVGVKNGLEALIAAWQ